MSEKLYFIYARVSDARYIESIRTQINILKGIANLEQNQFKFRDNTIISEHSSGSKGERPAFTEMINLLKKDAEIEPASKRKYAGVLFYKIDRLFRNFHDFHEIEKLMNEGYQFISGTETIENTPTGRLLFRMLAGFAIYESEKLSNRESLTYLMNALKNRFNSLGGMRPFGYKVSTSKDIKAEDVKEKFITVSPEESKIIYFIYTLRSNNPKISPKQILNEIIELPELWNPFKNLIEKRTQKSIESKIETLNRAEKLKNMKTPLNNESFEDDTRLEIEELSANKLSKNTTTEEKAIKIIDTCLRNKGGYKYNGLITRTFQINDELIQNFLKSLSSSDEDKMSHEFGNNQAEWDKDKFAIGTEITFTFYVPNLIIIDDVKYQKVQESFKKREPREGKKETGTLEGILYLRISDTEKVLMNTYQSAKNTIGYRRQFNRMSIEKSESSIENAIRNSDLFKNHSNINKFHDEIINYLEKYNSSVLVKQIRAEKMKRTVYNFQIRQGEEILKAIIRKANIKEDEQLFGMVKRELSYYSDLRKETENNIDQLEKDGRETISFFFHLLNGNVDIADKSERRLAYHAMFEYIEMPVNKESITIHLRQFMAQILGVPKEYTILLM